MTAHRAVRRTVGLVAALLTSGALAAGVAVAQPTLPPVPLPLPLPMPAPVPIPALDLNRYLGDWNQLAAVPQPYNLDCARDTRARYTLDPQGNVAVHNSCTTWAGGRNEIRGTAKVNDPVTGAQLHVSFPGVPNQDMLDGPTNYIVTAVAPDYSWALVTDPSRLSGFVLARSAALDAPTWDQVKSAITTAGQTPCMYLSSPTTGGRSDITPLCLR